MEETSGTPERPQRGAARRWTFGRAAFDERAMQMFVGGRAVELELKPLEVLRFLLQHPGEAISKDDLIKAVWPGRIISDSALTSTIAKLREALGEEQDAIRTVHGFGYRLEAEVRADGGDRSGTAGEPAAAGRSTRRLTAIMFTDLVGYSALAHRNEVLAIELLELHRGWVREILPRHGGREIETVGDAFLVEFSGALAAVECAVAIQRKFAEHNAAAPSERRMELRIGIHAGDVEHKDGKVMGDGVNIASRIHGMARPGGICVSEDVQRAVRNRPGFHLESIGSPALKNIATPLELFQLRVDPPDRRALLAGSLRPWARKVPGWLAAAMTLVLALGLAVAAYLSRVPQGEAQAASVAVLPFTNMSADKENAYFTDGMHDTILTHLSRVHALKVISRTSVMRFREGQRDIREIAQALGVDHVVEGSVQRAGNRLRITVQLIEAKSDRHVWAENYDRDMADVFAVQSDVAQRIADGLRARLAPAELARIERVPSRNAEAYDLYLRALVVHRTSPVRAQVEEAISWLERAVTLDPGFAHAYALMAEMHDYLYWGGGDQSDARREQLERSSARAVELDPGLAEAHVARGLYRYHGVRDYPAALESLETARALDPGNARVYFTLAHIYRRHGRWEEALASAERSASLDPLYGPYVENYADIVTRLRRYAEARQAYARAARLQPDDSNIAVSVAYVTFLEDGALAPLARAVAELPADPDHACKYASWRVWIHLATREFQEAIAAADTCRDGYYFIFRPVVFVQARVRWYASGRRGNPLAAQARLRLEQLLDTDPQWVAPRRAMLALAHVMLGENARALTEIERALEAVPTLDALDSTFMLQLAAEVFANTGAEERAVEVLEQLLRMPSGLHAQEVKLDPAWDPLRSTPRFQKLLAEHLPKDE